MELLDRRKIIIYQDHLARDYYNFGTNISCISILSNPWTFTQFGVTVEMFDSWNCHGSVWHAYDGSGDGYNINTVNWNVKKIISNTRPVGVGDLGQISRGDVIRYDILSPITGEWELAHSQTILDTNTSYGANNEPPTGGAETQSWKWATFEPGIWANNIPMLFYVSVLEKP